MIAAVRLGADAIYIGAKQFSARAGAHNFDDGELRECVRFCHTRGVKVYLALNTLLKLPFSKAFLSSGTTAALLVRCARYTVVAFVDFGVYPMLFRLER